VSKHGLIFDGKVDGIGINESNYQSLRKVGTSIEYLEDL